MKFLLVGLGNIGSEYANTRHNIGFMVLDELVKKHEVSFSTDKFAYKAEFKHKGKFFVLIKPTTYMNLSGKAVRYWMNAEKIEISNIIVITDDISLPFGKVRLRAKGSAGGHNGLKNIQELLESDQYARLRFGVGSAFPKGKQVDYVLSDFDVEEKNQLPALIQKSCEILTASATIGIERTMNFYNK